MSRREDSHVYSSTAHPRHRNHTAVSAANYCMFVDMTNMIIHGTSELSVVKKIIYPLVRDAQGCKKDVSNGHQYENSKHLEYDEMQCKTEVTKTLRTGLSSQNGFQKLLKIQPQGIQMASKIHSGGVPGGQIEEKTFLKASRTPQGPLLGNHLGLQNRFKPVVEALSRRK